MGSLREGYWADLILVDGDPLTDVRVLQDPARILMVVKGGKVEVDRRPRTPPRGYEECGRP